MADIEKTDPSPVKNLQGFTSNEISSHHFRSMKLTASGNHMAALYELGLSITAKLELKQVLYSLYKHINHLLHPEAFYIAMYDEKTHLCEYPLFYDQGEHRLMPPQDMQQTPGLTGEVIQKRRTLVLNDTLDPDTASRYSIARPGGGASSNGEIIRTYVGVPMISRSRIIGVISMQKYAPNAFPPDEIRLLETIANQAAIAIENSQLFESAQKELEQRRLVQAALEKANEQLKVQVKQIETLQEELREQAVRDPLTGLFNRRYLKDTLPREVARARRDGSSIGIMIMDIDEFKNINDQFGHDAGDRMLQEISELLRSNTRMGDIVCRYGGEEFVVVMPGATLQIVFERAELIRRKFDQMYVPHEGELLHATISLGVSAFPVHGADGEDALIRADRALYQAKQAGRNRAVAYRSSTKPFPKESGIS